MVWLVKTYALDGQSRVVLCKHSAEVLLVDLEQVLHCSATTLAQGIAVFFYSLFNFMSQALPLLQLHSSSLFKISGYDKKADFHVQGTPVNIIVGSHVWVEDPSVAWIDGQVTKINGNEVEIQLSDGRTVVEKLSKIYPKDEEAPAGGVDDMTKLSYLHEPGVLQNLAARYQLNEIYTYTGSILIAINPFQRLPHIYDSSMMEQYKGAPFGELSPHVFAIADVAYRAMINEGKSNSILVSGESGAGKTETTKMLMRYLAFLGGRKGTEGRTVEQQVLEILRLKYKNISGTPIAMLNSLVDQNCILLKQHQCTRHGWAYGVDARDSFEMSTGKMELSVPLVLCSYFLCRYVKCKGLLKLSYSKLVLSLCKTKVVQYYEELFPISNPVLEAFGNAKTVRNNNSSRFGKFVEIQFNKNGRISGAAIRTYLLERSRVCQVSDPERNYHCFYLLCAAPQEEIEKYKLGHPKTFHYLNQSNCYELVGINDAHDYLATRRAMDIVGISQKEQDAIFRVVAAILHLGNIEFAKGKEIDSSILKDEKSKFHLQTTAELLMCDPVALEDALLKRVMVTPEEVIKRSLDPDGATVSRDGLAKTTYSRLFDWLVDKINVSIGQDPNSKSLIGVLDIYGFESFKLNSFEQFCINFTNEKLQQHFNQHVFKMEQEEYTKEEIDWSYIEFVDNQDVLDLIEKKPGGIVALLDEACMFPKSTHETFSQKLYQTFKSHKRFIKPKLSRTDFTIAHYAGEVQYQSEQFLDKNKDYVVPEHQDLLVASKCSFVAGLFPPLPEETTKSSNKSSKFSSIGSRFKLQLQQLMETLNSTEPHYIRCVKPNNLLKPAVFENANIMQQLRCGGVLEAIRISCAGYPTRKTFYEFLLRFGLLAPEFLEGNTDERIACKKILEKLNLAGYQVMRISAALTKHYTLMDESLDHINVILLSPVSVYCELSTHGWTSQIGKTKVFLRAGQMAELDARRAQKLNNAAKTIQRKTRTHIARKHFLALQEAAVCIQSVCRGRLACKVYDGIKKEAASLKIQANLRCHLARRKYTNIKLAGVVLQTGMRSMAARKEFRYRRQTTAATLLQANWRGHRAFSYYKKLIRAAIITQCRWRGRAARRELRKLKMAARETGALQQAKDKLEKQVEDLTWRLQLEKRLRTDLEEAKGQEIAKLQQSLQDMQSKVDESNALLIKEREAAQKAIEEASSIVRETPVPVEDTKKIDALTAEVENLKTLLQSETQRADDSERRCAEALQSSEDKRQKLEETNKRVHQLQESLNRMIYSMSDQFLELKMTLSSSNFSSSSRFFGRESQGDATSTSSDTTSTDSDFTFPAPASTPANFSSLNPGAFQLVVQDLSAAEMSGSENWENDREGAFDDFF
ncbi:unnamed protein product [Coffea canephora]|uniref:Myosin motor domain-containing protein n=1 Tax=Coffea canephora TaxID=49390 RepID=A0A068U6E3_COFCA|nr:unnamed protein product [Coffea canephora]